jgi:uncharacterized protein YprB with RNaseH-like and TPR domain
MKLSPDQKKFAKKLIEDKDRLTVAQVRKMAVEKSPVIIILDIETAPIEALVWKIWEENVGLEQIKNEWNLLSFSYKYLGEKEVYFHSTGGRGASKVRDDSKLLKILWEVLDKADIVVTQNGKSFDIKKTNARMVMMGLPPYSPIRVIDTKVESKKHFGFTSVRLQWLSKHLTHIPKDEHEEFSGFKLWTECLNDNPAAWKAMEEYNKIDVLSDEAVYLTIRPWITNHPNLAAYSDSEDLACPKCNSTDIQLRGYRTLQTNLYHQFRCNQCGGWSRSRQSVLAPIKRKSLLGN